jgi:hypothetical protein
MKKTTTTLLAFHDDVRALERALELAPHVAEWCERNEHPAVSDAIREAGLLLSDPEPAAPSGQLARVKVEVATLWNLPPFGDHARPLEQLRRKLAEIAGVEAVGDASLDRQLRSMWQVPVVIRLAAQ